MGVLSGVNSLDTTDVPILSTSVVVGSGVVANASAVAALPAKVGQTAYLMGFLVSAAGSTAGANGTLTVTGLAGGTVTYAFTFPVGAQVPATLSFQPRIALPAAGSNTAITATLSAGGSGNVSASVTVQGFYQ